MIHIKTNNVLKSFRLSFLLLYESTYIPSDNELLKEDTLSMEINEKSTPKRIVIKKESVVNNFNYDKYFKNGQNIAKAECKYLTREIFQNKQVSKIIKYLRQYPDTKRAILFLWKDKYRNLEKECPCMSYAFFRKDYDKLNVNVHMRANNAYNLILIDIDTLRAVQKYIATNVGLKIGKYIHYVDSFHFYKKEKYLIEKKYKIFNNDKLYEK